MVAVPTAGGAVAVIYNLEGVDNLKLSRQNLVDIFTGAIQSWFDPRLAENNPEVRLPDGEIKPVVRSDAGGTTYIFTNHLSAVSESFKEEVGTSLTPRWKEGFLTARENAGIAQMVRQTPNSIGYVEAVYAIENKIPTAAIANKAGNFVLPTLPETNKAFADIKFGELPLIQGTLNYTEQIVHCIQYETCIISSLVRKNSDIISSVSSRSLSRPQWLPRKEERSQALWIIYLKLCGIPPSCPVMGRMQSLLS